MKTAQPQPYHAQHPPQIITINREEPRAQKNATAANITQHCNCSPALSAFTGAGTALPDDSVSRNRNGAALRPF
jgi:hypothetical protein